METKLPKDKAKKNNLLSPVFLTLIFILLFLLSAIVFSINSYSTPQINLDFETNKKEYYNFEKLIFSYNLHNLKNRNLENIVVNFSLCNLSKTECKVFYTKEISTLKGKDSVVRKEELPLINNFPEFGTKSAIFYVFLKNQPEKILSQQEQQITLKNLASELYLNLELNGTFFNTGDFVKLKYNFKNLTKLTLGKENFNLTLNYAGPVERAAGTGNIIKDLSQDIDPGQSLSGEDSWVLNDFANRLGGIYNVSLYFAFRDEEGKLLRIADIVRQIQWP